MSQCFLEQARQLRMEVDQLGHSQRRLHLLGDGSYCNRTTFRAELERTELTCRARKDLRLCFRQEGPGRRYYSEKTFTPEEVYSDPNVPWQKAIIFHGGKYRQVEFKEVTNVLWRKGGGKSPCDCSSCASATTAKAKRPSATGENAPTF